MHSHASSKLLITACNWGKHRATDTFKIQFNNELLKQRNFGRFETIFSLCYISRILCRQPKGSGKWWNLGCNTDVLTEDPLSEWNGDVSLGRRAFARIVSISFLSFGSPWPFLIFVFNSLTAKPPVVSRSWFTFGLTDDIAYKLRDKNENL